jgi:hypothetical protein
MSALLLECSMSSLIRRFVIQTETYPNVSKFLHYQRLKGIEVPEGLENAPISAGYFPITALYVSG